MPCNEIAYKPAFYFLRLVFLLIFIIPISIAAEPNTDTRGMNKDAAKEGAALKAPTTPGPEIILPEIQELPVPEAGGERSRKVALIIGNNNYSASSSMTSLSNAANDANAMAGALMKLGFDVMLELDLSREDTIGALNEFYKKIAMDASVAFFYYSGHGMQHQGDNYLIPVTSVIDKYDHIETNGVNFEELVVRLEKADAGTSILIFDACRSLPKLLKSDDLSQSVNAGLAQFSISTASFIAYSTSPGEAAFDGIGKNSPFTEGLVKWINEPGLTVEQVFKRVRRDVMRNTDNAQRPWELSSLTEEFYFIPPEESSELADFRTFDKAYAYFNIGLEQADEGRPEDAINSFTKVIDISPDYAEAYKERGTLYMSKKELDKSMEDLNKAIELNERFAAAYNNRGIVYSIKGEYNKALINFDKALEIDKSFLKAYNNKARLLQIEGKQKEALDMYAKALEIDPAYAPVYNNRGLLYFRDEMYKKAVKDFTNAIENDRGVADAYHNRGISYYYMGNNEEALKDYNDAILLDAEVFKYYRDRATLYEEMGFAKKAKSDREKAEELSQDKN